MNEIKLILKDSYYYFLSKIIPGIIAFIFLITFTRILGISLYGEYSLYFYKLNLFASFGFGWLLQSELRYGKSNKKKDIFSGHIFLFIFYSILSSSIIFFFYEKSFIVSIFFIFSIGVFSYLKTILQSNLLSKQVSLLVSLQSLLMIVIPYIYFSFISINID